jgi:hypothetical protein
MAVLHYPGHSVFCGAEMVCICCNSLAMQQYFGHAGIILCACKNSMAMMQKFVHAATV